MSIFIDETYFTSPDVSFRTLFIAVIHIEIKRWIYKARFENIARIRLFLQLMRKKDNSIII